MGTVERQRKAERKAETRASTRVDRWVTRLLRGRAAGVLVSAEERRAAAVAAGLRALWQRAATPSASFQAALLARVRAEADRTDHVPSEQGLRLGRRALLWSGGAAVALAAAALAVRHSLWPVPRPARWKTVGTAASFPPGSVMPTMVGTSFVFVIGGTARPRVLSGLCTDVGCPLHHTHGAAHLVCPCHGASFDLAGHPEPGGYWMHLPDLPEIPSRVYRGQLQVQLPRTKGHNNTIPL